MKSRYIFAALLLFAIAFISADYAESANLIDLGEGNYTRLRDKVIVLKASKGETLQNAINIIPTRGTIKLTGNISLDSPIKINKAVTIESANTSKNFPVLDGQNKTRIFEITGTGVNLNKLHILKGHSAECGGAVLIDDGSVIFSTCTLRFNSAPDGGSIYAKDSYVKLYGCSVQYCEAAKGAGVSLYDSTANISYGGMSDNSATENGGAVYAELGSLKISPASFRSNSAKNGGAVYAVNVSLNIDKGRFYTNSADLRGGAVFQSKGSMTLQSGIFVQNEAAEGGALYVDDVSPYEETECYYTKNTTKSIVNGQVQSSEHEDPASGETSGGGCNTSSIGLLALAVIILRRKYHHD